MLQDVAIDGGDTEELEKGPKGLPRAGFAQLAREKIVDCGNGMGCEKAFSFAVFDSSTNSRTRGNVGPAIEEYVKNDVGIQEEASLHRYFLTRCLR